MKTYKIITEKQAEIDGKLYPIKFDGHAYNIYVGGNPDEFTRKWVSLGKAFAIGDSGEFDENGGRITQPKKLAITIEKLHELFAEMPEALAIVDGFVEEAKAEQERAAKENKIAKLQEQLAKLMAE